MRINLERAYADGTLAVDMDPLCLLCRLATSVPPPRRHTLQYAGVLAPASAWRQSLVPRGGSDPKPRSQATFAYRPWAQVLKRTFDVDVLACPKCEGRMEAMALVEDLASPARYLAAVGEATEVPQRSPGRGPPVVEEPHPARTTM